MLEANLIDGLNLFVAPVVVGGCKRLFGEGTSPSSMSLTASEVTSSGVIVATYEAPEALVQKSFEVADGAIVVV